MTYVLYIFNRNSLDLAPTSTRDYVACRTLGQILLDAFTTQTGRPRSAVWQSYARTGPVRGRTVAYDAHGDGAAATCLARTVRYTPELKNSIRRKLRARGT